MRRAVSLELRRIVRGICEELEVPRDRTYMSHKVTGEIRVAGERAMYLMAKKLYRGVKS